MGHWGVKWFKQRSKGLSQFHRVNSKGLFVLTCQLRFPSISKKMNGHSGDLFESVPRCGTWAVKNPHPSPFSQQEKGHLRWSECPGEKWMWSEPSHRGHGIGSAALIFGSYKMMPTMLDLQTWPVNGFWTLGSASRYPVSLTARWSWDSKRSHFSLCFWGLISCIIIQFTTETMMSHFPRLGFCILEPDVRAHAGFMSPPKLTCNYSETA